MRILCVECIRRTVFWTYSDFNVATDRDNILARYFNAGFPEASFTATADRITEERKPGATQEGKGAENNGKEEQKKE